MKRTSVLLFAVCLISGLCSCASPVEPEETVTSAVPDSSDTTSLHAEIPAIDAGGMEFTVLDQNRVAGTFNLYFEEFNVDEMNGDVVNDAVYELNMKLSEKYNIVLNSVKNDSAANTLKNSVMAGDSEFSLANISISNAINLSSQQILLDWKKVPYVDTDKPWWFTSVAVDSSVCGHLYYAMSDANINAFNSVGVTCFNKNMIDEYQLDNPYELVKNGQWTIDALMRMSRAVSADLDGNSVRDQNDMYGLATNNFVWLPLFYGTDTTFITKDTDDTPVLSFSEERVTEVLTKIVDMVADREAVFYGESFNSVIPNGRAELPRKLFIEGRALFWIELMYSIPTLRETEVDFGILPMPKLDDTQASYSTYMHDIASVLVIPVTNTEIELTGSILEDMAYQASLLVRPAYIEKLIKGKISRDEDTAEMFDYIYEKIHNDFIIHLSGTNINTGVRKFLDQTDYGFSSFFASNNEMIASKLADLVSAVKAGD